MKDVEGKELANLNEMEKKVFLFIANNVDTDYRGNNSPVYLLETEDAVKNLSITKHQFAGYISVLNDKGYVTCEDAGGENGNEPLIFVNVNPKEFL